jgi:hypothetical protein
MGRAILISVFALLPRPPENAKRTPKLDREIEHVNWTLPDQTESSGVKLFMDVIY